MAKIVHHKFSELLYGLILSNQKLRKTQIFSLQWYKTANPDTILRARESVNTELKADGL